jgi:opacity protein-like surface antigen
MGIHACVRNLTIAAFGGLTLLASSTLAPAPGLAAESFYVRASGGITNTDKLSALSSNPTDVLSGKSDKSGVFDVALGFALTKAIPFVGVRAEGGLTVRPDLNFVTNTVSGGKVGTSSLSGQQYTAMGNVYFDAVSLPLFKPYVGGGIGAAHSNIGNSDTNFAWNVMVGASVSFLPLTSFDLMLRHVDSGQLSGRALTSAGTSTLNFSSRATANEALVGVKFGF